MECSKGQSCRKLFSVAISELERLFDDIAPGAVSSSSGGVCESRKELPVPLEGRSLEIEISGFQVIKNNN